MRSYRLFTEAVKKIIPDVELHTALDAQQETIVDSLLPQNVDDVPIEVIILYLEGGRHGALLKRLKGAEAVRVLFEEWKHGKWSDWVRVGARREGR